ncbi:hypothetical protein HK405_008106, partial [Cladochytrium tenue]
LFSVLVTVREGRNFPSTNTAGARPSSRVYLQCRFNNEILTTDPEPLVPDPVWDTELAWDIPAKPLGFLRSQRAKLKLVAYEIDSAGARSQLGYIVLDLRSAQASRPRWAADPALDRAAAWSWCPLLNYARSSAAASPSPFRPEIRVGFCIVPKSAPAARPPPSQRPARSRPPSATVPLFVAPSSPRSPPRFPTRVHPAPARSPRLQSASRRRIFAEDGDAEDRGAIDHDEGGEAEGDDDDDDHNGGGDDIDMPTPSRAPLGENFVTTSGLVVVRDSDGAFLVESVNSDVDDVSPQRWWTVSLTIAFVENLALIAGTQADAAGGQPSTGIYFYYSFLGTDVLSRPFADAAEPAFPPDRTAFRIRCPLRALHSLLTDLDLLTLYICRDAAVLGFAEIRLAELAHAAPGAAFEETGKPDAINSVVEKVYPIYDPSGVVPMSVDACTPSVGVSLVLSASAASDSADRQRQDRDRVLAPAQSVPPTTVPAATDTNVAPLGSTSAPDSNANTTTATSQPFAPAPASAPVAAHQDQLPPSWHRYRFSVDLRSIRGLSASTLLPEDIDTIARPGALPVAVYTRYAYPPFGADDPVCCPAFELPIRQPTTGADNAAAGSGPELFLPHSFCAFEFAMPPDRLHTYLDAVPLALEFRLAGAPNRPPSSKDPVVATATVALAAVLDAPPRPRAAPVAQNLDLTAKDALAAELPPLRSAVVTAAILSLPTTRTAAPDRLALDAVRAVGEICIALALEELGGADSLPSLDVPAVPRQLANSANPPPITTPAQPSVYRGRSDHAASPAPPSPSPSSSTSIHQTGEYRAALDLALWQRAEMHRFQAHLAHLEADLVARLKTEAEARDAARAAAVTARLKDLDALDADARQLAARLQARERAIDARDAEVARREADLDRAATMADDEYRRAAERLGEDCRARVEAERARTADAEAARLRAVRDRDDLDARLRRALRDLDETRSLHAAAAHITAPPAVAAPAAAAQPAALPAGNDQPALKDLDALRRALAAAEKRAAAAERARRRYKALWTAAVRDLEAERRAAAANAHLQLRIAAAAVSPAVSAASAAAAAAAATAVTADGPSPLDVVANERHPLRQSVAAVVNPAAKPHAHPTTAASATHTAVRKPSVPETPTAAASAAIAAALANSPKRAPQAPSENLDPARLREAERLVRERDALLGSRGYTREDRLIRELDARIGRLLLPDAGAPAAPPRTALADMA